MTPKEGTSVFFLSKFFPGPSMTFLFFSSKKIRFKKEHFSVNLEGNRHLFPFFFVTTNGGIKDQPNFSRSKNSSRLWRTAFGQKKLGIRGASYGGDMVCHPFVFFPKTEWRKHAIGTTYRIVPVVIYLQLETWVHCV